MTVILIRYGVPFLIAILLQIYLSHKENKFWGLILPSISIIMTIILFINAHDTIGKAYSIIIMLIPNITSFLTYFLTRKFKKYQEERIIKKFKDK